MSVSKITHKGFDIVFKRDKAFVKNSNGEIKMTADRIGDLYYVHESENGMKNTQDERVAFQTSVEKFKLWHYRMGYLNPKSMVEADR